jgi:hypothetical protein
MGTGRKFRKAPRVRPKKKPIERRRREATQKKRLVALGMDEAKVSKLNSKEARELLKRPAKIAS